MTAKQPIVILGGGMAALAAAYELSCTDELRNRYSVTIYQRGWRLGGKCASSRGTHPADRHSMRVEEHGLHVWFGFYFNAFHMLRKCYAELGGSFTVAGMFERRNSTPMMEFRNGRFLLWPLSFPPDAPDVEPGTQANLPSLPEVVTRLVRLIADNLREIIAKMPNSTAPAAPAAIDWLRNMFAPADWVDAEVGNVFGLATVPHPGVLPLMTLTASSIARWHGVLAAIQSVLPEEASLGDGLRRAWIIADLAAAIVRGLASQASEIARDGLGALDDRDFRAWLEECGAHPESISSAPVRALYDLCFAYSDGDSSSFATADFAAGTALRCVLRITMGYSGAVCYAMKVGMGEAVIGPIYEVLRRNGVGFEFFHKVDRLELANGGISAVHFTCQAETLSGAQYRPTATSPTGLMSWPPEPDYAQLVNGDVLKNTPHIDFESDVSPRWRGDVSKSLNFNDPQWRGAKVVLAISVGGLRRITAALDTRGSSWAKMLSGLPTVATQAAQLWMTMDLARLGYADPARPPAMIAAPEPMDVWADMTPVIASEGWSSELRPASVQYICGPLSGSFADPQQALGQARNIVIFSTEAHIANSPT